MGNIKLSFVEYSASKLVHLQPDIVEYHRGSALPLYNIIIGKETSDDMGAVLDFIERP
jgi:hypothetical protein